MAKADTPARRKVVVVTGASSGIGRATALELAKAGYDVVVAARREEPLESLVAECEARGVLCLAVPTDVADAGQVAALAHSAQEYFGHFDAWVNNAGVFLVGRLEDMPLEDFRRVLETNLLGVVYGTREAVKHFRARDAGVIVNVASVYGEVPAPYASAYVASKFAVRGFTASVREELLGTGIRLSTVLPAAIDTPLWEHAGNVMGRQVRPIEPVYTPERVARAIVACVERPRRTVYAGPAGRAFAALHTLAPGLTERLMRRVADVRHFERRGQPPTHGNVQEPVAHGQGTRAGWHEGRRAWARLAGLSALPGLLARAVRRAAPA